MTSAAAGLHIDTNRRFAPSRIRAATTAVAAQDLMGLRASTSAARSFTRRSDSPSFRRFACPASAFTFNQRLEWL